MMKIKDLSNGYSVHYDEQYYNFKVLDSNGKELFSDTDQRKLEDKFEKWVKQELKRGFPIECLKRESGGYYNNYREQLVYAKITSYNPEDNSVWVSTTDGNRNKEDILRETDLYEITEYNKSAIELLKQANLNIELAQQAKKKLIASLEKPIGTNFLNAKIANKG